MTGMFKKTRAVEKADELYCGGPLFALLVVTGRSFLEKPVSGCTATLVAALAI